MKVSFDLDDTLVCYDPKVPKERDILASLLKLVFPEPLRFGTVLLIKHLTDRGCKIWIYTSSNRSPKYIRTWLSLYGIKLEGIVNSDIHKRAVETGLSPETVSKYPPAFGISLHIDDSEGVMLEGKKHGFNVLQIKPQDSDWVEIVLKKVDSIKQ